MTGKAKLWVLLAGLKQLAWQMVPLVCLAPSLSGRSNLQYMTKSLSCYNQSFSQCFRSPSWDFLASGKSFMVQFMVRIYACIMQSTIYNLFLLFSLNTSTSYNDALTILHKANIEETVYIVKVGPIWLEKRVMRQRCLLYDFNGGRFSINLLSGVELNIVILLQTALLIWSKISTNFVFTNLTCDSCFNAK